MKLSNHTIQQGLHGVKSFIQRGYHSAKGFAEGIDSAVGAARKVHGVLSPYLDSLIGSSHSKGVRKALEGYDEIKNRAVKAHGQGEQAYQKIRSEVPELNF
jgi:hypothetical protein